MKRGRGWWLLSDVAALGLLFAGVAWAAALVFFGSLVAQILIAAATGKQTNDTPR